MYVPKKRIPVHIAKTNRTSGRNRWIKDAELNTMDSLVLTDIYPKTSLSDKTTCSRAHGRMFTLDTDPGTWNTP